MPKKDCFEFNNSSFHRGEKDVKTIYRTSHNFNNPRTDQNVKKNNKSFFTSHSLFLTRSHNLSTNRNGKYMYWKYNTQFFYMFITRALKPEQKSPSVYILQCSRVDWELRCRASFYFFLPSFVVCENENYLHRKIRRHSMRFFSCFLQKKKNWMKIWKEREESQ